MGLKKLFAVVLGLLLLELEFWYALLFATPNPDPGPKSQVLQEGVSFDPTLTLWLAGEA